VFSIVEGLAVIGIALTYFPTKHSRMNNTTVTNILKRLDWVGGLLLTVGFTLLYVCMTNAIMSKTDLDVV
jgi:uncharacterized protein YjeT (DUF2065 family)